MSQPRGFGLNGKSVYENIAKPMVVNLSFVVDSANTNGLGVSSIKSNGYIQNVFMHTSQTPGSFNGKLNPNPAVGYALIQFTNNFNASLNSFLAVQSPNAGSSLTSVTTGSVYVINALGTTTAAQWLAAGVPAGLTAAVGMSFVAKETASIGGTGTVQAPGVSGIGSFEIVGNPNVSLNNAAVGANGGAYIMVQFLSPTSSSVTTPIATAPANQSVISMCFRFDGSTVSIPDSSGVAGL